MKEKNTLKKFISFRYTDLTAVCEYLEEMEAQGWQLVSMGMLSEFRKCEPRKVRYAAELLESASAISNSISDKSQDYIDMCEQAGWKFICNIGKMFIFRTESETAPEIVTDSAEKLAGIKKAMLKTNLLTWFVLPLIILFNLSMQLQSIGSIAVLATQYIALATMLIYAMFYLTVILQITGFTKWYIKAKRAVTDGQKIPYVGLKQLRRRKLETYIPLAVLGSILLLASVMACTQGNLFVISYSVAIIFIAIITLGISQFMSKRKASAAMVIISSVLFSFAIINIVVIGTVQYVTTNNKYNIDKPHQGPVYSKSGELIIDDNSIPVSLNELGAKLPEGGKVENEAWGNRTHFASRIKYYSHYSLMSSEPVILEYEVYFSKYDALKRIYKKNLLKNFNSENQSDPNMWGALEAYKSVFENYIKYTVIYDDYILEYFGNSLTAEDEVIEKFAAEFQSALVSS